jgi:hypothetical protein
MVVIDSIPQIGALYDMEVSPDGGFLYNCVRRGRGYDSLRCIDIKRKEIVWSVPRTPPYNSLALLDNGRIILGRKGFGTGAADLIDASTGRIIKVLSDSIRYDEGPVSGTKVSGLVGTYPDSRVVGVDVLTGEVWGEFRPHYPGGPPLPTAFTRLHPDGDKVLALDGVDIGVSGAIIGSLSTGNTLITGRMYSPFGEGQFSADGRLAAVGDKNSFLRVFDLDSMTTIAWPDIENGFATQIEFIGDSHVIVTAQFGDYFQGTDPLVRIDLTALQATHGLLLPLPEPLVGPLAVGLRP